MRGGVPRKGRAIERDGAQRLRHRPELWPEDRVERGSHDHHQSSRSAAAYPPPPVAVQQPTAQQFASPPATPPPAAPAPPCANAEMVPVGDVTYTKCGATWYTQALGASGPVYVQSAPPPGS